MRFPALITGTLKDVVVSAANTKDMVADNVSDVSDSLPASPLADTKSEREAQKSVSCEQQTLSKTVKEIAQRKQKEFLYYASNLQIEGKFLLENIKF